MVDNNEHRLTQVEERSKSNTKRINKLEEQTAAIHNLATSMAVMAEKQEETNAIVTDLDGKVSALEAKPAKRWDSFVDKVLWAIVGAAITYILVSIGLG